MIVFILLAVNSISCSQDNDQSIITPKGTLILKSSEISPILVAVYKDDIKKIKSLMESGIDPNAKDEYGRTPLHAAAAVGNVNAVRTLIAYGADINIKSTGRVQAVPILIQAATNAHFDVVKILLESGANPKVQDNAGLTALFWAACIRQSVRPAEEMRAKVIKILVEYGCDINAKEWSSGRTALDAARSVGNNQLVKIIQEYGGKSGL